MDRPNKNVTRGEATRGQLIAVARRMFAEHGYEDTSIEAVLREAGVSRGSLYHHFASKEALFEAVAEDVETTVGTQTIAATAGTDGPVAALRAASLAWVRLAGDPVVQRILLIDGPAVVQAAAPQAHLRPELADTLAHVLLASVNEVALLVARSDDPQAAMKAGEEAVDELLRRLLG